MGIAQEIRDHLAQAAPGITAELVVETSDAMRTQVERAELDLAVVPVVTDRPRSGGT